MLYWVYENWVHSKAMIHLGSCSFCNHGNGLHSDADSEYGWWLGPFDDFETALNKANGTGQPDVRGCKVCGVENYIDTAKEISFTMRAMSVAEQSLGKEREWVVVGDLAGVDLSLSWLKYIGHSDEGPLYDPRYGVGFDIKPNADIVAYDVRFVFFDIWEKHLVTWKATEAVDVACGKRHSAAVIVWDDYKLGTSWRSLHDDYQTCLVYVEQVRLKDGSIDKNHIDQIVEVVRDSSVQFGKGRVRVDGRRRVYNVQYVNTE